MHAWQEGLIVLAVSIVIAACIIISNLMVWG